jgi:hypothetical protein
LRRQYTKPGRVRPDEPLDQLHRQVIAVDGTFLHIASGVAWAVRRSGKNKAGARLDFHVDIDTWLPEVIVVPEPGQSETDSALRTIIPGAIHIYDRGIFSFELVQAHLRIPAEFVMRLREPGPRCPKFQTRETRDISSEAQQAGVISDGLGQLVGSEHRRAPGTQLRELIIVPPDDPDHPVRILTNLLDVDALVIAALYRHRWQIELFFRWIKCYARFDHLISHNRDAVLMSFYVAVIGMMLMYLHTANRPSKYLFSMMSMVASGSATLEEIMPIVRERERRIQLERERVARKRAEKRG